MSVVTAAALPHLQASRGAAAVPLLGERVAHVAVAGARAAYLVSKAAVDKMVEAWRTEHPELGFTRVAVGDCRRWRG